MGFKTTFIAAVVLLGTAAGAQADPEKIALAAGCQVCHAADKNLLGPSYQAIADKYRGEEDAADRLLAVLRKGGGGVWGQIPKLAVDPYAVPDEDLKSVIRWILEHEGSKPAAN